MLYNHAENDAALQGMEDLLLEEGLQRQPVREIGSLAIMVVQRVLSTQWFCGTTVVSTQWFCGTEGG